MTPTPATRRAFLAGAGRSATALLLSLQLPWLASLEGCATESPSPGRPFTGLTAGETRAMEALATQVLPPLHGAAGAAELGAVQFVSRALREPFFAAAVPVVREGLADLDTRARARQGRKDFASLGMPEQSGIIRQIERGDFFKAARTLVLIGAFADPSHGGNRGGAGWVTIGIDHRPSYAPPFGYYDALPVGQRGRGAA